MLMPRRCLLRAGRYFKNQVGKDVKMCRACRACYYAEFPFIQLNIPIRGGQKPLSLVPGCPSSVCTGFLPRFSRLIRERKPLRNHNQNNK